MRVRACVRLYACACMFARACSYACVKLCVYKPDARVVGMLREFMYRHVGEVLKEGQVWAEYRSGPNTRIELDISDIQMAVEFKIKHKNGICVYTRMHNSTQRYMPTLRACVHVYMLACMHTDRQTDRSTD